MAGLYNEQGGINIPAALGILALGKLAQGAFRHNQYNNQVDLTNQALPQGYQLPHQKGWFNFNDPATNKAGIAAAAAQKLQRYNADDLLTGLQGQGVNVPFHSPQNVQNFSDKVYIPGQANNYQEGLKQTRENAQGRAMANTLPILAQLGQQAIGQPTHTQSLPPMPMNGLDNSDLPGGLSAGVSQSVTAPPPNLPTGQDYFYDPKLVRQALQNATTTRGQDLTAETSRRGQDLQHSDRQSQQKFNEKKYNAEAPLRQAKLKKITADIAKVQQDMKLKPQLVRAQIARLSRQTGHSPNSIELMLQSGKSPKQIGDLLFKKAAFEAGEDPDMMQPSPSPKPSGLSAAAAAYLGR